MGIPNFIMSEDIGRPVDGDGIRYEFSASGINITDSMGRDAQIAPDHMDVLVERWLAYKAGVGVALAKVAA